MTTNGLKTSEFWLSVLAMIAATIVLITGDIDAEKWVFVIGGSTGAYSLARGLAKVGPSTPNYNVPTEVNANVNIEPSH